MHRESPSRPRTSPTRRFDTVGPMPSSFPALSIDCAFGHAEALGTLSAEISLGEIVVLTGKNGSGKSTLVDTVAGELAPHRGTVRVSVDGRAVDPATPEGAGTVTRIAEPAFFPDLTIHEHLAFLARRAGVTLDDMWGRVGPWEVADLPDDLPSRLSNGQRQRANLALQLAVAAPVVVLDEPERHLDGAWTRVLCDQLGDLAMFGSPVLVASHSDTVVGAADREIAL